MKIIENYLKKIDSDLYKLLNKYDKVVTFENEKDIKIGLLKYNSPPKNIAFLFKFKDEKNLVFHTIGMKFPINIHFFNKEGNIIFSDKVKPGVEKIHSKQPCMYVVEIA